MSEFPTSWENPQWSAHLVCNWCGSSWEPISRPGLGREGLGDDPLEGWTQELMDEKEVWEGLEPALEGDAVSLSFPTVHARYMQSPSL